MYRKRPRQQLTFNFALPFGGKLRKDNRWVILADLIPWDEIEDQYASLFEGSDTGGEGKPCRVALGALIIKERLGITDRETVEQISENPYLQYFLGFSAYTDEEPFHHTSMVHFRKRFTRESLAEINEQILARKLSQARKQAMSSQAESFAQDEGSDSKQDASDDDAPSDGTQNSGKLIIDATCTPADITFPTDLKLLNEAREKTEEIIDCMHRPFIGQRRKPRTYRQKARKDYLALAKQRKRTKNALGKGIRKQLNYVKRNLKTIDKMASKGLLKLLDRRLYRLVLVCHEVYRQQRWMYEHRSHRIENRLVSLYQPHVRPIVRGKPQSPAEFGAKISVSLVDGLSFVDTLSWDAYNETGDLKAQVESYRQRFGHYPESVHADQIYRTRDNRRYCKKNHIRLSGPPLGRPAKQTDQNKKELQALKRQRKEDERYRNGIEGKFGQGKRRFTLNRIMAKLAETSEAVIMVSFIVMNLEKLLRDVFLSLFDIVTAVWLATCQRCWGLRRYSLIMTRRAMGCTSAVAW
jgi:hypothetical protein